MALCPSLVGPTHESESAGWKGKAWLPDAMWSPIATDTFLKDLISTMAKEKSHYLERSLMKCQMTEFMCQSKGKSAPVLSLSHMRQLFLALEGAVRRGQMFCGVLVTNSWGKRSGIFFVEANGVARASRAPGWMQILSLLFLGLKTEVSSHPTTGCGCCVLGFHRGVY